jgi:hypothetical protein
MMFDLHIGIDYSGASTAETPQAGIRVFLCDGGHPKQVRSPAYRPGQPRHWTRREVADWIISELGHRERRFILGLDHAFSFPATYLKRFKLSDWPTFLKDCCRHWPTDRPGVSVESLRKGNRRIGKRTEFRLVDTWSSSAKSVFEFDVQGAVAKSTHAGIPWLAKTRDVLGARVHCWPLDGWEVPEGKSVIAEVYPSIFRRRYGPKPKAWTPDEWDAYAVARWLREADERGILDQYLHPPLTAGEKRLAGREGWILGIC